MEDKCSVFSRTENLESAAAKWVGPMREAGELGRSIREGHGKVCLREDIIMKLICQ